ncbi:MAG: response regulator [Bacteroidales bacterium]|nr:response regulator [Bacteroidales bacterium]
MMASNEYNWSEKTFLIVEDNKNNYELLETFLKRTKAKIIWVLDGVEAVETCRNNTEIDMVLMDIQLKTMNGFDATRKIREFNQDIPVIAQTAYAMVGDREKSIQAGCNDYISKPIRKQIFLSTIEKYIGNL